MMAAKKRNRLRAMRTIMVDVFRKIKENRLIIKEFMRKGDNYEALAMIQKSVLLIDNLIS